MHGNGSGSDFEELTPKPLDRRNSSSETPPNTWSNYEVLDLPRLRSFGFFGKDIFGLCAAAVFVWLLLSTVYECGCFK